MSKIFNEMPFDLTSEEEEIFKNNLPENIKKLNGDEFVKNAELYIIKNIIGYKSKEEYKKSNIYKDYINNQQYLSKNLLFKHQKFKIYFSVVFFTNQNSKKEFTSVNKGAIEITATTKEKARNHAFFAVAENLLRNEYVIKSIDITKIELSEQ